MKNLLYLAILTTFVVISWVGFGIYNASVTSTIAPDTSIIITPIPKSFNQSTIISIKNKRIIPANLAEKRNDQIIVSSGSANVESVNPTPEPSPIPAEVQNQSSISAQPEL